MMMFSHSVRFVLIAAGALTLAACATTSQTEKGYTNRIDAALARAAEASGANAASLPLLAKLYSRDPKNVDNAIKYAVALRTTGDYGRAMTILEPFAQKSDAGPALLTECATLKLNIAQYAEAESYAAKAVAKDDKAFRTYQILGIALDAQGKYPEAEKAFRHALEIWKGDPVPIMNNLALNLTNQERLDEALDIMERAKKAAPDRKDVERNLRIIRTLNETSSGRPAPKPAEKPATP